MNIEAGKLSKNELLNRVRAAAKNEQSLTLDVIVLIREINARQIYLELGFGSLFDFVTKDLGYEATSAHRRISAARLIAAVPETEEKMRSGELSLSVVSRAQTYFRHEERRTGERVTIQEKIEVLKELEKTSSREAEKILVSRSPENIKYFEKQRELTSEYTELKIVLDKELKSELDELKLLLAHQSPNLSYVDLIRLMVKKTKQSIKQKVINSDKITNNINKSKTESFVLPVLQSKTEAKVKVKVKSKIESFGRSHNDLSADQNSGTTNRSDRKISTMNPSTIHHSDAANATVKRSRFISSKIKQTIWRRDKGCCQFVSKSTGRKCGSNYFVEIDHIHRFADGGANELSNLRLICRSHNQFRG